MIEQRKQDGARRLSRSITLSSVAFSPDGLPYKGHTYIRDDSRLSYAQAGIF